MTNEFLPFAIGGSANVEAQAAYAASSTVTNGFLSGLVPSNRFNKALRQASFVASCLAQYMANTLGVSILDDGNVATMLTHLGAVLGNLPGTTVHGVPYQSAAGVTSYTAAPTTPGQALVWDGTNIVWGSGNGDVVHWDSPAVGSGWKIGGNGINEQWVTQLVTGAGTGPTVTITYPSNTAFASEAILDSITVIDPSRAGAANPADSIIFGAVSVGLTSCVLYLGSNGGGTRDVTVVVKLRGK